jgi:hypothetical protein
MQRVGDGVKHHPGTAEDTGPLADRAGQTLGFTFYLKGLIALLVNLSFPLFEYRYGGHFIYPLRL